MAKFYWLFLAFLGGFFVFGVANYARADALKVYEIQPSKVDPTVTNFDDPSYAILNPKGPPDAPLVVFLTGTNGKPRGAAGLLAVVANQGYRVIGLEYDDSPAVAQVCPKDPDPACSAAFRQMRISGEGSSRTVTNPPSEGIVARLTSALRALDRDYQSDGWGRYLTGDAPAWDRIVVSGLSQGAGMAAYIAKQHAVDRVVLFSSPWDTTGPDHRPAPWLSMPSATPVDRWYAEYHRRENTAALIAQAYAALKIPADHIRVFDHDIPAGLRLGNSPNPFHVSTIRDEAYAADWREMFGAATAGYGRPS
jgi:hypothetical protein